MTELHEPPSKPDLQFVNHLDKWMSELPFAVRCLPLINLAIPGSHDSMSFGIARNAAVAPDAEPAIHHVYKVAPCIVRRWAITQNLNATQQLEAGVRYFDLRFSLKRSAGQTQFHFVHGLFAQEVKKPFFEMLSFLQQHPREFIVFDCQHFYEFYREDYKNLCDEMRMIFGNRIYGPFDGSLGQLTLEMAERLKKQVLVIFRNDAFLPEDFWPSYAWPTPWPDQYKVKNLQTFLDESLHGRSFESGYVTQCVLTPPTHFIILHLYSSLRRSCAESVRRQLFDWIAVQRPGVFDGMQTPTCNVFIADFVNLNDNEFCKLVVGLNAKLLFDFVDVELNNDDTDAGRKSFSKKFNKMIK